MTDIVELLRDAISDEHVPPLYLEAADEIDRLRAELSELRKAEVHAREIGWSLVAERDALQEDAERYRWLRENFSELVFLRTDPNPPHDLIGFCNGSPEELDAAIDAARREA